MNPFTRALLKRLDNRRTERFVARWDQLEALIIRIYKAGSATPEDEAEFRRIQAWLSKHYPRWKVSLGRYWPQVRAGVEVLESDPFESLLSIPGAGDIPGNWTAMQILPAAREVVNHYLMDEIRE
jgi:hypothetical protein